MRSTKRLLLVAIPAALLAVAAALAFRSAQRTWSRSAEIARTQHQLGFAMATLDASAGASQTAIFQPVASSAAFTSGAFFGGELYLASPAGLSIYSAGGTLLRELRTGLELPVAPIVAVSQGRLRGASQPALLLATAGAGLLLLEPSPHGAPTLRQLLPGSVSARDLTAVLPLASGDVLLGTRHSGVLIFNGATLSPLRLSTGSGTASTTASGNGPDSALEISALAAAGATSLLIGTRNSGLFYLHGGTVQHAGFGNGLPDDQVDSIVAAGGKAYAGTPLGVAEFDLDQAGAATLQPTRVLAAGTFSHALALPPEGRTATLLVGSLDQGIAEVPLEARPRLRHAALSFSGSASAPAQRIDQFLAPSAGSPALYAIADGTVLVRTPSGWTRALPPQPQQRLADRNISALAFAPDGSLYVGFFDHGLDVLAPGPGGTARHFEDDHLFCVNRLALDPRHGTIAAATANGLVLFDRQGTPRQVLTRRDGLISDHITDVAYTRSGMTLATPAGLTFLGPAGAESLYAFQGLVNNHVYALGAGIESDRLVAGTLGGLSLLDSGAVRRNLTVANSELRHNWITAVTAGPQGGWLIGTYGAGLMTLSPDSPENGPAHLASVELPAGAPRNLVINPNALLVTPGHIYAGTLGQGMLVFTASTPSAGTNGHWGLVTHGLPSLNVTAFAQRNGEIFIGTDNGLMHTNERQLDALAGGTAQ